MPISLRIVGILYNRADIPDDTPQTVQSVLDYAVKNPGSDALPSDNFKYISSVTAPGVLNGKPSVAAFFSNYRDEVESPTSRLKYPKGEYFLSESLVENPSYAVWQFYVFDNDGAQIMPIPRIQSYQDAVVPAGGSVIWRLVKILAAPNRVPTVYRNAFGLADQTKAVVG